MTETSLVVIAGAFVGGFVSALTGFGSWIGRRVYNALDNARFEKAVLILLLLSGCMLFIGGLHLQLR